MNNATLFLLTAALTVASAWPIAKVVSAGSNSGRMAVVSSNDGAYRDGVYLGGLDAQAGRRPRPAAGRWSQDADRNLFRAGYTAGYARTITMVR
jgi:hypothetical protein